MKSKLAAQLQNTILVLKQRQGASLAQIRKRLKLNNGVDVQNKKLSHTLNSLVQKGKVEKQPNGVYKLARGGAEEEEVPSRRRALPHGPSKTHRRYYKLRSRRGHRHRRRRRRHSRRRRRRHSRRRRAFPPGRGKPHRRYHKVRRSAGGKRRYAGAGKLSVR